MKRNNNEYWWSQAARNDEEKLNNSFPSEIKLAVTTGESDTSATGLSTMDALGALSDYFRKRMTENTRTDGPQNRRPLSHRETTFEPSPNGLSKKEETRHVFFRCDRDSGEVSIATERTCPKRLDRADSEICDTTTRVSRAGT